ncbi:MAG TPA: hypothetical protein VIM98_13170 [Dyella sp.]|uniref:hypothetical protein n=1 Tax=Dyella sp. TaxID=1869338 RepID=UPI002F93A1E0
MSEPFNPYSAPMARVADAPRDDANTEQVLSGQKWVIYAILLYFLTAAIPSLPWGALGAIAADAMLLIALIMALIGVRRLRSGLGFHPALSVFCLVLMFAPLLNILLLVLSSQANSRLRAAGYKVGLLGARR